MESLAAYSLLDLKHSSSPSLSSTSTSVSTSPCSIVSIHPCNVKNCCDVAVDNEHKWNEAATKDRCEDTTVNNGTKTNVSNYSDENGEDNHHHSTVIVVHSQPHHHSLSQTIIEHGQQLKINNEDAATNKTVSNDGKHASTTKHRVISFTDIKCSKCDSDDLSDDHPLSMKMQDAWLSISNRYKGRVSDNDNSGDSDPAFLTCKRDACGKCFALCKKDGCYKLLLLRDKEKMTSSTFRNYVQHVEKMHRKRARLDYDDDIDDADDLSDSQEIVKRRKSTSSNNKGDVFINHSIGTSHQEHQTKANLIPIMNLLQSKSIPVTNARYLIENGSDSFVKLNDDKDKEGFVAIWVKGRMDVANVWEVSRVGLLKMSVFNNGSFELDNEDAVLDLQTGVSCSLIKFTMMDTIPQLNSVVIDYCKTSECMNPAQFSYLTKITKEIYQDQSQSQHQHHLISDASTNHQQEILSLTPRERKTSEFLANLRLQSNVSV